MDTILGEIFGNKEIGKNYLGLTFFFKHFFIQNFIT